MCVCVHVYRSVLVCDLHHNINYVDLIITIYAFAVSSLLFFGLHVCSTIGFRILLMTPLVYYNSLSMEMIAAGEELLKRGNEVYIIIADTNVEGNFLSNLPQNITPLKYQLKEHIPTAFELESTIMEGYFYGVSDNLIFTATSLEFYRAELSDEAFLAKIRSLKFDLALATSLTFQLVLPRLLNIPFAYISSLYKPFLGGSPSLPIFPCNIILNINDQMNFWQRLNNFIHLAAYDLYTMMEWNGQKELVQEFYNKYSPGVTNEQLLGESQIFFITSDYLLEWPSPIMPNVKRIPPLLYSSSKPLSSEFNELASSVASSQYGIIVISFGTFAHHLSPDCISRMLSVFIRLKQTIVWKVTSLDMDAKQIEKNVKPFSNHSSHNVHVYSCNIPQNDLLGHKNTRLFITHSGNNGQYEAVYYGIPMVALHFYLDQPHNAFRIADHGYGVALNAKTFTSEQLFKAVNEVLFNGTYREKAMKASAILHDYPMTGRESVAYWSEHVIKFGNNHLRSRAADLVWYDYFTIDVVVTVCTCLFFMASMASLILRRITSDLYMP